jgi:hypothetical protein
MTLRRVAAVAAVVLLGACASSGAGVSKPAGHLLQAEVQSIRLAARGANRAEAERGLSDLRASVTELRASGDLSADAAARIRDAASSVEAELALIPLPTTTTTTTTTTTLPNPGPGRGHHDHGPKDPGAGKGHDH